MPIKDYISFYKGIAGDDYVAQPGNYLWGENIDGTRTGYGVTLGPKVNKQFFSDVPVLDISNINDFNENDSYLVGHNGVDTGYVYNIESVDNTEIRTLTVTETDNFFLKKTIEFNGDFWVIGTNSVTGANTDVHRFDIEISDGTIGRTEEFDVLDTAGINFVNSYIPPHIIFAGSLYLGGRGAIVKITPSGSSYTYTSFSFSGLQDITGITIHNTIVYVYDRNGEVRYWKGLESIVEGQNKYPFAIEKVSQQGEYDIATTIDGELVAVGGATGTDISSPRKSKYGETFGTYFDVKNFSIGSRTDVSDTVISTGYGNFLIGEGKHLYKFGKLFPGIEPSFHNICTKNHSGLDIDRIYTLAYRASESKLFFSYKAGVVYGVDYIDLSSMESCGSGAMYFNVHRGVPNADNQIISHFFTTSDTNGTAFIKIYIRVDNGTWKLVKNINDATNVIKKGKSDSNKYQFVDCQIKVEFSNADLDEFPPMLHSLFQRYKVINTQ